MITVSQIKEAVSHEFDISCQDMESRDRHFRVSHPRQVAMMLTRQLTEHSFPRIGHFFGGRDHSTVMHGISAVWDRAGQDDEFAARINRLFNQLEPVNAGDKSRQSFVNTRSLAA